MKNIDILVKRKLLKCLEIQMAVYFIGTTALGTRPTNNNSRSLADILNMIFSIEYHKHYSDSFVLVEVPLRYHYHSVITPLWYHTVTVTVKLR